MNNPHHSTPKVQHSQHKLENTKQFCPMCRSDNVVLWLGGTTGTYRCTDCGYVGPLIIERNIDNSKLQE